MDSVKAESRRTLPGAPMVRRKKVERSAASRVSDVQRGEMLKDFKGVTRGLRVGWGDAERGWPGETEMRWGEERAVVPPAGDRPRGSEPQGLDSGRFLISAQLFRDREARERAVPAGGVRVLDFSSGGWQAGECAALAGVIRRAAESRPGDFFSPREVPVCFRGITAAWPATRWRDFFLAAGWDGESAAMLAGGEPGYFKSDREEGAGV